MLASFNNPETILVIASIVCGVLLLMVTGLLMRTNNLLKKNLKQAAGFNGILTESIARLAERNEEFAAEYQRMQTDLTMRELYSGSDDLYLQAINAARSGLNEAEIVENYGLTPSEAQLIVSVHSTQEKAAA